MNKPQYIATPEAVAICPNWTEATQRWVKADELGYNKCELTLHLHSKSGRKIDTDEFGLPWFEFQVAIVDRVRWIAGLEPGVYKNETGLFLVPQCLRYDEPRPSEPPPKEFTRIARKIAHLIKTKADHEAIEELKNELIHIYEQTRNVRIEHERNYAKRMLHPIREEGFPYDEKGQFFRGKVRPIWTSQPFNYDPAEIAGFAYAHNFEVTISPAWSWRWPGKSVLIEWTHKRKHPSRSGLHHTATHPSPPIRPELN